MNTIFWWNESFYGFQLVSLYFVYTWKRLWFWLRLDWLTPSLSRWLPFSKKHYKNFLHSKLMQFICSFFIYILFYWDFFFPILFSYISLILFFIIIPIISLIGHPTNEGPTKRYHPFEFSCIRCTNSSIVVDSPVFIPKTNIISLPNAFKFQKKFYIFFL